MSQANVEIVRRVLDAYSRRDLATITVLNDPEIEVDWSASHGWYADVYHGNDAIIQLLEGFFQAFEMFVVEVDSYIPVGDSVVVPNVAYQRGREGIQSSARSTFVFTLHDRKITKIRLYQETADALKAVGLEE
jgi:ketosteroid isomerase-like protein